ncbi:Zinc finger protein [Plakobranchus ocellatus]|uniref:Zinc finger protein n=1 Tax=Plakobranchus ocellatus TaxID=259542 RepID=A0AAV4D2U1_9GAST|nr:Zinc finger protein [Plakobranchus ocellatus]
MQWKGPFDVLMAFNANDMRINVNGKRKTFNANLLKSYITRDIVSDETPAGEKHVRTLRELFRWLHRANFTMRPTKCVLGARTIDFPGHRLGKGAIRLQNENIEKV